MIESSLPELSEAARISRWLAQRGWSEGAGGNLSIRLTHVSEQVKQLEGSEPRPLPLAVPRLAGSYLLISGHGTRARDAAEDVAAAVGLYRVSVEGTHYVWLWGNSHPSSELPSHAAIHETLMEVRPDHCAVVHTHPANLIALTHLSQFRDGQHLSDVLFRMQSEARLILPEGVAYLPHYLPGSLELGLASARALRRCFVVLWHLHGAIASGESLSRAMDYLEVVDKAAQIYWIVTSAGYQPNGMSDEEIRATLEHFGRWDRYLASL